jgi:3-hydroxyacyl-CoA dehydrogenase
MVAYKSGAEIEKLIEIHRVRATAEATVTLTLTLTYSFDELRTFVERVNGFVAEKISEKWFDGTEEQCALLTAMEALAAALPSQAPG